MLSPVIINQLFTLGSSLFMISQLTRLTCLRFAVCASHPAGDAHVAQEARVGAHCGRGGHLVALSVLPDRRHGRLSHRRHQVPRRQPLPRWAGARGGWRGKEQRLHHFYLGAAIGRGPQSSFLLGEGNKPRSYFITDFFLFKVPINCSVWQNMW